VNLWAASVASAGVPQGTLAGVYFGGWVER